jgi:hypothetical protein
VDIEGENDECQCQMLVVNDHHRGRLHRHRHAEETDIARRSFVFDFNRYKRAFSQRWGPIRLHIVLANISSKNVGLSVVPGVFPYEVDVRDSDGVLVPETDYGRKMRGRQNGYTLAEHTLLLKPGERQEVDCTVSEWNDLSKPGIYVIQVQREDHPSIRSNKLIVTVTP